MASNRSVIDRSGSAANRSASSRRPCVRSASTSRSAFEEKCAYRAPLLTPAAAAMSATRVPSYPRSAKTSAAARNSRSRVSAAVTPAIRPIKELKERSSDSSIPASQRGAVKGGGEAGGWTEERWSEERATERRGKEPPSKKLRSRAGLALSRGTEPGQLVAGRVEAADTVPVDERVHWPVVGVAARGGRVPAVTPGLPHRGVTGRRDPGGERTLHLGTHVDPAGALAIQRLQRPKHVPDLAFEHV